MGRAAVGGALASLVVLVAAMAWAFLLGGREPEYPLCCANTLCNTPHNNLFELSNMHDYLEPYPEEWLEWTRTAVSAGLRADERPLVAILGGNAATEPHSRSLYTGLVVPLSANVFVVEANKELIAPLTSTLGELGVNLSRVSIVNAMVGASEEKDAKFHTVPSYPLASLENPDLLQAVFSLDATEAHDRVTKVVVQGHTPRGVFERNGVQLSEISFLTVDFTTNGSMLEKLFKEPGFSPRVVFYHYTDPGSAHRMTQGMSDLGYDVRHRGLYCHAFRASASPFKTCRGAPSQQRPRLL